MRWPVMIFAAGFGTRMRHLTAEQPKPLVPVNGKALIDHALALAAQLPAAKTVVNLHYKPQPLLRHLQGRAVETILETPDILDTGGGLRNALPALGQTEVMTLNSDAVWAGPNPLHLLAKAWDPARMDGLLMCIPMEQAVAYGGTGDFQIAADGRVSRGAGVVYGCAQIIKTNRLAEISTPCFSLNVLWDLLIAENRLYATQYPGRWCDVGTPEAIAPAEKMLRSHHV